ncbi:retrovirus-related pol polyprotein from transposon TNT 1-94 [Tanacetum coccineum]|uniref:Retrovirus-related pol polyprotein from transposon TNT 1-94 n=1 Tax=Tanacetum coccineum TaxID=301880 RepID=A0ABQ5IAI2_9ASTR
MQFLKDAAKFVRNFKSLAKEADESLDKIMILEKENECLLRAVVSQDIMSIVQNTLDHFSQKLNDENVSLEFQVMSLEKENEHLKAIYQNLFDSIKQTRINPLKNSRKDYFVPNKQVKASVKTKPITVSQPHVITKNDVNSNSNGLSSTRVERTAKARRPHPKSNTKNDRVPSASKSSCIKNKEVKVEVEDHPRNLQLSKNQKHMSSECNNIKLAIRNDKSKFVSVMCKQFFITANHDVRVLNYVNDMNSRADNQNANVFNTANQKKHKAKVKKSKKLDLEVVFRRNTCFVRNLKGLDLLKGNRTTNLYTINLHEMASASPICLMGCATLTKSWLWHQRLSNLNFDIINELAKNDLPGKSKTAPHKPKPVPNSKQRLHLLHMDLCGLMKVKSIYGKWYVLVIVDDYSRYTWVYFLRSKDEAPEVIKTFLKKIQVFLQTPVIIIRTDNGTEFTNQVLKAYFKSVGFSHQMSLVRTPLQNGVFERRNRMLVEAARTMLIFSCAPLSLWAEAIATARKLDISFLHVFEALCYPKNDHKDIRKLGAKGDIGFFIGYYANSCAHRVYNRMTQKIMETMNVMTFEQRSSKPELPGMSSGHISSGLDITYAPSTITSQKPTERKLDLLFEAMYDDYIGGQSSDATTTAPAALATQNL